MNKNTFAPAVYWHTLPTSPETYVMAVVTYLDGDMVTSTVLSQRYRSDNIERDIARMREDYTILSIVYGTGDYTGDETVWLLR